MKINVRFVDGIRSVPAMIKKVKFNSLTMTFEKFEREPKPDSRWHFYQNWDGQWAARRRDGSDLQPA